ncbi:hypothetical protein B0O99DRAFT_653169 [Bisporella sp. PMI_857]|nr:hypothetical protein B0O99DRAFT_653169 [Bisporella sp. PMI_857]
MSAHGFQNASELPAPSLKPTSPTRPKHQTHRSITEIPGAFPKLHRPIHHHGHIHRHKDHKDKGKETQSAHPSLQGGRDLWSHSAGTRSEDVTPEQSRGPSRRASLLSKGDDAGILVEEGADKRRIVKEGELQAEKEKAELRAIELHNTLSSLNTLSNDTTRRLDNTYYSVLEKLSTIQSTIASMKELATLTKQLNDDFVQESEEVIEEVETSLDGFEGFEKQQKRIGDLAARVKAGRNKIKVLVSRVEVVREKINTWEKMEVEWQESTRKRLRILWIVIAVTGLLITGVLAFQYTPAKTQGPAVIKGWNASLVGGALSDEENIVNETFNLRRHTEEALAKLKEPDKEEEVLTDEPRLRVFDEL